MVASWGLSVAAVVAPRSRPPPPFCSKIPLKNSHVASMATPLHGIELCLLQTSFHTLTSPQLLGCQLGTQYHGSSSPSKSTATPVLLEKATSKQLCGQHGHSTQWNRALSFANIVSYLQLTPVARMPAGVQVCWLWWSPKDVRHPRFAPKFH